MTRRMLVDDFRCFCLCFPYQLESNISIAIFCVVSFFQYSGCFKLLMQWWKGDFSEWKTVRFSSHQRESSRAEHRISIRLSEALISFFLARSIVLIMTLWRCRTESTDRERQSREHAIDKISRVGKIKIKWWWWARIYRLTEYGVRWVRVGQAGWCVTHECQHVNQFSLLSQPSIGCSIEHRSEKPQASTESCKSRHTRTTHHSKFISR